MSGAYEAERTREQAENDVVRRVAQEWCGWDVTDTDCERLKRLFGHLKAGDPLPGDCEVVSSAEMAALKKRITELERERDSLRARRREGERG